MTLEDLHRTVVEGFSRIDERFARIEHRLARNEARWEQNEAGELQPKDGGCTPMTVEMSDWVRKETETRRAWRASMEPLLKSLEDSNAVLRKIIIEQERLRQPSEKPPLTAAPSSPD